AARASQRERLALQLVGVVVCEDREGDLRWKLRRLPTPVATRTESDSALPSSLPCEPLDRGFRGGAIARPRHAEDPEGTPPPPARTAGREGDAPAPRGGPSTKFSNVRPLSNGVRPPCNPPPGPPATARVAPLFNPHRLYTTVDAESTQAASRSESSEQN